MVSFPARFWREGSEKLAPEERTEKPGDRKMNLNAKTAKLHWVVMMVALTLATVAAQSPFF